MAGSMLQRTVLRIRNPVAEQQRTAVIQHLDDGSMLRGETGRHFLVLGVLSSIIAALGLLLDSAAAVIGAMLLGQFMTPLLAVAVSLLRGRARQAVRAATTVLVGVVVSAGSAFVVGWIVSARVDTDSLRPQLAALTHPGLLDLGIALAAGAAAGHATHRTRAGAALTGVAVSVTLEPPLAAMGLFLYGGNDDGFRHASLAFATNFIALVVGAVAALAWGGFGARVRGESRTHATVGLVMWTLSLAAVAVPLTVYSKTVVRSNQVRDSVEQAVVDWDPSVEVASVVTRVSSGTAQIELSITGPQSPPAVQDLADSIAERSDLEVELDVQFTLVEELTTTATQP